MSAIDFKSLMREERKKRRSNREKKPPSSLGDSDDDGGHQVVRSGSSVAEALPCPGYALSPFSPHEILVCQEPPSIYYLPSALSTTDQAHLSDWLLTQLPENPMASCDDPVQCNGKWTTMKYAQRRVALFDARIQPFPEPLLSMVQFLSQSLQEVGSPLTDNNHHNTPAPFQINHILVNDYSTAEQGILPHTDGPAYESCTATLSLESDAVLHFTRRRPAQEILPNNNPPHNSADQPLQVWLEKGSLVIFCQEAYSDWMHSIPTNETSIALDPIQCVNLGSSSDDDATSSSPQMVHRGDRRISLTFRMAK